MAGLIAPGTPIDDQKPYMRLVPNAEIDEENRREQEKSEVTTDPLPQLTSYIRVCWEQAKRAKQEIQKEILEDYRQRIDMYDPDKLAEIREQGGSEIFMPLTSLKAALLESWIIDVMVPADERPWDLKPTPIVDLPPALMQRVQAEATMEVQEALQMGVGMPNQSEFIERFNELAEQVKERAKEVAKEASEKMAVQIEDNLTEGGWDDALPEAIYDFITTKACIVHGPVPRMRKRLKWVQNEQGQFLAEETEEKIKTYSRVSPLDAYPSPDSSGIDDGYFIHHQRLTPGDLYAMKGVPGFKDEAIDAVLEDYGTGGLREWMWRDQERAEVEQKIHHMHENAERRIDTVVFHGPVSGKKLEEWGVPGLEPYREYEITGWLIGRHLIGVRRNTIPGGKRPYAKASMEEIPGAFWGIGFCRKIRHLQAMCNGAGRAVSNDMGLTAMFQTVVNDISRIPEGESVTQASPGKTWQFLQDKYGTTNRPPIDFFQPQSNSAALIGVYEKFSAMVDELVPSYFNGNQNINGAGETATGLSMLMTQANKFVKRTIGNLDRGLVKRVVYMTYLREMLYNPSPEIKGDLQIIPRGAVALLVKEQQQMRRAEFLAATNNPVDLEIVGTGGRATLLREAAKTLDMPVDEIVPDKDAIEAQARQAEINGQVQQVLAGVAESMGVSPEQMMAMATQGPQPE